MTIVITDSGFGGLSVMAGIEEKLRNIANHKSLRLIFFNALPARNRGYNSMKTTKEKAFWFNKVLNMMYLKYKPDKILIACNTLSVIYNETAFSKNGMNKVEGIVNYGVDSIYENLLSFPESIAILLGTETTISSQMHKNKLIEKGIAEQRITMQACPDLESAIQESPKSKSTKELIEKYVNEALLKRKNKYHSLKIALLCTHYGYAADEFRKIFSRKTETDINIINPNQLMIDAVLQNSLSNTKSFEYLVVSKAKYTKKELEPLAKLISCDAPDTAKALLQYQFIEDLF